MDTQTILAETGLAQKWACIKDNKVVTIVVSDPSFISVLKQENGWDAVVRYDNCDLPHPHIGCDVVTADNGDGTHEYTFTRTLKREAVQKDTNIKIDVSYVEFQVTHKVDEKSGEILTAKTPVLTPKDKLPPDTATKTVIEVEPALPVVDIPIGSA